MTAKKVSKKAPRNASKKASNKAPARGRAAAKPAADDIVQLILADHKPVKKLIKTLKDTEESLAKRRAAFEQFGALLIAHAKSEEQALYVYMKEDKELRTEGFEGDVEHMIAEQLLDECRATSDEDLWSAQAKVLAELVEHHIEEEEEEMLPDFRKHSSAEERAELGRKYLHFKAKFDNWSEEAGMRSPQPTELRAQH